MSGSRGMLDAIKLAAGTKGMMPVSLLDATVVEVDEVKRICLVNIETPGREVDGLPVRMMPSISDGDYNIPEVGSTVIVAFTQITEPYIADTSSLSKKIIIVEDSSIEVHPNEILLNDGSFGGMTKVPELVKRINILEDDLNDLKSAFQGLIAPIITEPGNGNPSAFQTAFITALSQYIASSLIKTKRGDIENELIKHGKAPQ